MLRVMNAPMQEGTQHVLPASNPAPGGDNRFVGKRGGGGFRPPLETDNRSAFGGVKPPPHSALGFLQALTIRKAPQERELLRGRGKPQRLSAHDARTNQSWLAYKALSSAALVYTLLIILCVQLCEALLSLGKFIQRIDRRSFTDRNASAAVNALNRAYKKLAGFCELGFILARMNAVNGTNVNAFLIFRAIASYNVSHKSRLLVLVAVGGPEPRSVCMAYHRPYSHFQTRALYPSNFRSKTSVFSD